MVLASVGQFCATASLEANAQIVCRLIKDTVKAGAKVLFLPEASDYITSNPTESLALAKPVESSPFINMIKKTLQEIDESCRPELSIGVHEPTSSGDRVKNTLLWFNKHGEIANRYQKVHLFDVDLSHTGGQTLKESTNVEPGEQINPPFASSIGQIGPAICYDIRFPEQALKLRQLGAHILVYPSAFTIKTGYAHWQVLARSRAIDTQSYVIMAAQVGKHDANRQSYGHSLIVDPWGTVIAQAPDVDSEPCIITADINLDLVTKVRRNMPLWDQRRPELY